MTPNLVDFGPKWTDSGLSELTSTNIISYKEPHHFGGVSFNRLCHFSVRRQPRFSQNRAWTVLNNMNNSKGREQLNNIKSQHERYGNVYSSVPKLRDNLFLFWKEPPDVVSIGRDCC